MFFRKNLFIILFSFLVISGYILASSLSPTGSPDTSYVTLSDIENKIQDINYSTSTNPHNFEPSVGPTNSGSTLEDIYTSVSNILSNINPETIITTHNATTTVLGATGTYDVSNLTPDQVATGTIYGNGLVGTRIPTPVEVATVDLAAVFPHQSTPSCPVPDYVRSITIGPYSFPVIIYAKTADVGADDYLRINGTNVSKTSLGWCGSNDRIYTTGSIGKGDELIRIDPNTEIKIEDVDTVGSGAGATGILSIVKE